MSSSHAVIEISDSDDDAQPPPPSSSQVSATSRYSDNDVLDICSSDEDLPAPGDPEFFRVLGDAKRRRHSSASASTRSSCVDYCGDGGLDSTDDEEASPKKVPRKSRASTSKSIRKPRKTEEEKAAEKEVKRQEAERKKVQKAAARAEKAAQTAAEKEAKKSHKDANKLVGDKKATLQDMEIILSPSFADSPLYHAFCTRVAEYNMTVSVAPTRAVRGFDVFSWRSTMSKRYDPAARAWLPVAPYIKNEKTYLVYMTADKLVECLRDEDGAKNVVRRVRSVYDGHPDGPLQIFFMIEGLKAFLRRRSRIQYTKDDIERALAALQMAEGIHLLYVETVPDAVERLYDLSADLGIKPYKLVERSHLPFCADTHQSTGADLADTWTKMLAQVHRVTEAGAAGIAARFPTPRALFSAYEDVTDASADEWAARDAVVMNCTVSHRVDGTAKDRAVGPALSRVVGTVMWERDPLALAYRGT
ncbi:hypothetical protein GGX14DRAFT_701109 [Mycena pura]|uniref:ERCC4 domain-containing protein n=1 Tax=Mycena pura TaxID=153505 RepID=A0AAD6UVZ6_9AGAR|nr:hypothetical protein GGX14DRAFT_701109 [Mycena pura]